MTARRARPVAGGLVLAVLVSFASGCNAMLGPTEVDKNWHTFDSAHFTLHVRPGSFAETNQVRLGEVLDDQYQWSQTVLGVTYAGRILAFLYDSGSDAGLQSDYSGVAYPSTEAMRATCVPPIDGNLFGLLQHEANHVIQKNTMGRPGTSFMNEGLAGAVKSTRFHDYGAAFLYDWTAAHLSVIPPLADLVDDEKWNGSDVAYKSSASFLAYLIERTGAGSIRSLYQVPSKDFDRRITEIAGAPLDTLDREWRAFCTAQAGARSRTP
jgi:hypothetical protein